MGAKRSKFPLLGTAVIKEKKDSCWLVTFDPGLPYDDKTKGVPHRCAAVVKTVLLDCGRPRHAFLICREKPRGVPDPSYVYAIVYGKKLDGALADIGYRIEDGVELRRNRLRKQALALLSDEQKDALGLPHKRSGEEPAYEED